MNLEQQKQQQKPEEKKPISSETVQENKVSTTETIAEIEKARGLVKIMHGALEVEYDVAGKSVNYIREALAAVLSIPKEAAAVVNGQTIDRNTENQHQLNQMDTLEFIRSSGTKGAL